MRTSLLLLLFSLFFMACKNKDAATDGNDSATTETTMADTKYTLTPFGASTTYPDAKIESMSYTNGKFNFKLGEGQYKLGVQTPDAPQKMCANSDKGQHIHLIVDNEPYVAQYVANFEHNMADGDHHLLAFLSRSYHESIKTDNAYVAQKVNVKNKGIASADVIAEPMLFYSRPKGTYVGKSETDKVMLDFYLVNPSMVPGYKIKAEINGEEHMIDKWQPYYIEGLPMGDNTIKLTLMDGEGKVVNTPLNPVSRTFTLKADPVES